MDPEQVPAESFPLSEKKNVFEVSLKDLKSNYPDKKNFFFFLFFFFWIDHHQFISVRLDILISTTFSFFNFASAPANISVFIKSLSIQEAMLNLTSLGCKIEVEACYL